MADPLTLLAYVAASAYAKNKRDKAAEAQVLAKQQQAQQEEQAANIVHEWGYAADDTDKTFLTKRQPGAVGHGKGWTTTRRRIGGKDKDIKEVSPNTEQSQKLYQDETGTIDFMSAFEDKRSVFGTMPNLTHVGFGFRNKDGKLEPSYFPDHLANKGKPSEEKDVFLFRGRDKDDKIVYGATKAEVEDKAVTGSVSQLGLKPSQVKAVAPDIDVTTLPTAKVDPVAAPATSKRIQMVGLTADGTKVYGRDAKQLREQGAVKIGEAPFEGPKQVGNIKFFDLDKDGDKTKVTMMIDVQEKGDKNAPIQSIPYSEFRNSPNKYTPTGQPYELNPEDNKRQYQSGALLSISDAKNAINSSQAFYRSPKYTNALNKEERFEVPLNTQTSGKPAAQLRLMTQWINSGTLPRKEGKVD